MAGWPGTVVTCSHLPRHERQRLAALVHELGGAYSADLVVRAGGARATTHLVLGAVGGGDDEGAKARVARTAGLPVVSTRWVEASAAQGCFLSPYKYLVAPPARRLTAASTTEPAAAPVSPERLRAALAQPPGPLAPFVQQDEHAAAATTQSPAAAAAAAVDTRPELAATAPPSPPKRAPTPSPTPLVAGCLEEDLAADLPPLVPAEAADDDCGARPAATPGAPATIAGSAATTGSDTKIARFMSMLPRITTVRGGGGGGGSGGDSDDRGAHPTPAATTASVPTAGDDRAPGSPASPRTTSLRRNLGAEESCFARAWASGRASQWRFPPAAPAVAVARWLSAAPPPLPPQARGRGCAPPSAPPACPPPPPSTWAPRWCSPPCGQCWTACALTTAGRGR